MMFNRKNVSKRYVTLEQFLDQAALKSGVYDGYYGKPWREILNPHNAIAYERGRHLGIFAKCKKINYRRLYDMKRNKLIPTAILMFLCREMKKENSYI